VTQDSSDERFMREAVNEACKGIGHTSPNPAVGAILVQGTKVLARGHHHARGEAHAEVECLAAFGRPVPADATLYVTLEPCSTTGRTPPCTTRLIEAGVRRVVLGAIDPNPVHAGRGIGILRNAGIEVVTGVLEVECTAMNEAFNKWIRTKRPFVIAKCGMSLDGRLTRPPGEERWITSAASRKHANRFRGQVDAILIGAETLRSDDPRLTVRGVKGARQPLRVVLSRSGRLPAEAHVFRDRFPERTIVFGEQPLAEVLDSLGAREITSVLIEGGGEILTQALEDKLIDKVHIYVGPLFAGGSTVAFAGTGAASTQEAVQLKEVNYEQIGTDVFLSGRTNYSDAQSE
jgi:diaminohydroxyphosphoribosylaminopyrimidine deaminase/5-amino-6-(5-phosphoribosylamino)uracil reductase